MTIVITGAAGFLGREVVRACAMAGHSVLAVDRVETSSLAGRAVRFLLADLSDPADLSKLLSAAGPGAVLVHLAWDMRRHLGFAVQAEALRQFAALLDHAAAHGVTRVVAMGSAEEYGSAEGVLRETTASVPPLSPYGWAKRAAFDLAVAWGARSGVPVAWLRPFIIYGPGQRGEMMIPYAVERARRRERAEFTDGLQRRDFVHVADVADAVVRAAGASLPGVEPLNLGRGEGVAVADVLTTIARAFDAESCFQLGARPRRPGEPDLQVADTRRAESLLGWRARIGWQEGIAQVCGGAP